MKRKTLIRELKNFAKNESVEIKNFISRYEKSIKPGYYGKKSKFKYNGFDNYEDYLKSPIWKSIRNRVFNKKGKICERCKSTKRLNVHHSSYAPNVMNGNDISKLYVLCESCHQRVHDIQKNDNVTLKKATKIVLDLKVSFGFDPVKTDLSNEIKNLKRMKKNIR